MIPYPVDIACLKLTKAQSNGVKRVQKNQRDTRTLPLLIWDKIFKNGLRKICGRQPLKELKGYGVFKQNISLQIFERLSPTNFT